jgi:hypothetical protein
VRRDRLAQANAHADAIRLDISSKPVTVFGGPEDTAPIVAEIVTKLCFGNTFRYVRLYTPQEVMEGIGIDGHVARSKGVLRHQIKKAQSPDLLWGNDIMLALFGVFRYL